MELTEARRIQMCPPMFLSENIQGRNIDIYNIDAALDTTSKGMGINLEGFGSELSTDNVKVHTSGSHAPLNRLTCLSENPDYKRAKVIVPTVIAKLSEAHDRAKLAWKPGESVVDGPPAMNDLQQQDFARWIRFQENYAALKASGIKDPHAHDRACRDLYAV